MTLQGPTAFIGIGNMGWPMAANLVAAGFDVRVFDVDAARVSRFAEEAGGQAAASAEMAVQAAKTVITMLPTSDHVESVLAEGRPALCPGAIVVDMSSGVPAQTRRLAEDLATIGVDLIDCPVSGGVGRAVDAELAIMAGGSDDQIARVMPMLTTLGTSVHHCGRTGSGQAMKALNNLVSAGGFLVAAEALLIGRSAGLDPARMLQVLNESSGMNNSTKSKIGQYVLTDRFDSGFGLDLMVKDLGIALGVGREGGLVTPFAGLCQQLWAGAASVLGPGEDHTAIVKFAELLSGTTIIPPQAPSVSGGERR